jgi:hypothetical protein
MKAYRDQTGKVTLFRPDMNMKRMNSSARRIALPVGLALLCSPSVPYHFCADIQRRCAFRTDQRIATP